MTGHHQTTTTTNRNAMTVKDIQAEYSTPVLSAHYERGSRSSDVQVRSSWDAFEVLRTLLAPDNFREEFWILLLNRQNKITGAFKVSEGGVSGTVVDAKIVFSVAISALASSIILCHNHPSGNRQPSPADRDLTKKLVEAGKLLDICVLDHLILFDDGREGYTSFADEGWM